MAFTFITGLVSSAFLRAVSWTLLHSCWQGLIAAIMAGMIISGTRKVRPEWRYNLLVAVLGLFLLANLVTFLQQPGLFSQTSVGMNVISGEDSAGGISIVNSGQGAQVTSLFKKAFLDRLVHFGNEYASVITFLWMASFLINLFRIVLGLRSAGRLCHHQTSQADVEWKERLHTLGSLLGLRYRVDLKASSLISMPVVTGWLKPIILVPTSMFANLSVAQVEAIFVHELAHVRRRDFSVNLLQRITESAYFFQSLYLVAFIADP